MVEWTRECRNDFLFCSYFVVAFEAPFSYIPFMQKHVFPPTCRFVELNGINWDEIVLAGIYLFCSYPLFFIISWFLIYMIYKEFVHFSDPAIGQTTHPRQKLVGYEEEASALHQRLEMIS